MKNYIVLDSMIGNQKDVLCTAFDEGYKQGLEDGKESVQIDETEAYLMGTENAAKQFQPELKRAYNDGLKDAWELRKTCV